MSTALESRVEKLMEALHPEPERLMVVVFRSFTPVRKPALVTRPYFVLGRYATGFFVGGTQRERQRALRKLRASKEFDRPLEVQASLKDRAVLPAEDDGDGEADA